MRYLFASLSGFLLMVALIPSVLLAVMTLGFKGVFSLLGLFFTIDSPGIQRSGPPLKSEDALAIQQCFADMISPYYFYSSIAVIVISGLLLIVYWGIMICCIKRSHRAVFVFSGIGLVANLLFLCWISGPYLSTSLSFNDIGLPFPWIYPTLSILLIVALAYVSSKHRFPTEPPILAS